MIFYSMTSVSAVIDSISTEANITSPVCRQSLKKILKWFQFKCLCKVCQQPMKVMRIQLVSGDELWCKKCTLLCR